MAEMQYHEDTKVRPRKEMNSEREELIKIFDLLPEGKRAAAVDFARFLLARHGDEQWEQIIADPQPRSKFDAFLGASKAEAAERDHRRH
jgi:hypothetical protein